MVNDSDCLWKMNLSIEIEYEKSKRTSNGGLIFYKKQIVNKIENDCANGNIHNKHANEKIIKNLKISFSYLSSFLKKIRSHAIIENIYVYFTSIERVKNSFNR